MIEHIEPLALIAWALLYLFVATYQLWRIAFIQAKHDRIYAGWEKEDYVGVTP